MSGGSRCFTLLERLIVACGMYCSSPGVTGGWLREHMSSTASSSIPTNTGLQGNCQQETHKLQHTPVQRLLKAHGSAMHLAGQVVTTIHHSHEYHYPLANVYSNPQLWSPGGQLTSHSPVCGQMHVTLTLCLLLQQTEGKILMVGMEGCVFECR